MWTYQANLDRTCYICYVTLPALQKMLNLPFTVLSLYIMTCAVYGYVIVKSHYEEVIVVVTRVQGGAEDECNNNDNLRMQWDF